MWSESFTLDLEQETYDLSKVASFRRPKDEFGAFSNMSQAFPLRVFGLRVGSSEHLYQAARFSEHPEVQAAVLKAHTPMFAKQAAREFDAWTRADWFEIRVAVMRWALRVKLAQHVETFGSLLEATGERPIVEWSRHDQFWGAFPLDDMTVRGQNVLGKLLTELRDEFCRQSRDSAAIVPSPRIPGLRLMGAEIGSLFPNRPDNPEPFVTSQDLLALGLPPGSAFGFVTQVCLQKQFAGEFTDKIEALRFAELLWKDRSSVTANIEPCEVADNELPSVSRNALASGS